MLLWAFFLLGLCACLCLPSPSCPVSSPCLYTFPATFLSQQLHVGMLCLYYCSLYPPFHLLAAHDMPATFLLFWWEDLSCVSTSLACFSPMRCTLSQRAAAWHSRPSFLPTLALLFTNDLAAALIFSLPLLCCMAWVTIACGIAFHLHRWTFL